MTIEQAKELIDLGKKLDVQVTVERYKSDISVRFRKTEEFFDYFRAASALRVIELTEFHRLPVVMN